MSIVAITVLGSGSKGNATVIHTKDSALLVDAGFSRTDMLNRLFRAGIDTSSIKGLIITHDHSDHIKGARLIADHLGVNTYAACLPADKDRARQQFGAKPERFIPGDDFVIDVFHVQSFPIPHDATNPVGFVIQVENKRIGIATDLGHISTSIKSHLSGCDAIIIESNHDISMLQESNRPQILKNRISGELGHLNNADAINSFDELFDDRTQAVILCHLSDECNCPDKVAILAEKKLKQMGRNDIHLSVTKQHEPLNTVWIA
jgi:phosphoribosyl 1,2-cyclic phosphodiesterase